MRGGAEHRLGLASGAAAPGEVTILHSISPPFVSFSFSFWRCGENLTSLNRAVAMKCSINERQTKAHDLFTHI